MKNFRWISAMLVVCALRINAQTAESNEATVSSDAKIKLGALLQVWNTTNFESKDLGTKDFNTFRMRRLEIKTSGKIGERVSFTFMIDAAKLLSNSAEKTDSVRTNGKQQVDGAKTKQSEYAILQDAYIAYLLDKQRNVVLQVGQFKYPLTYEGLASSGKLNFIERAEITRAFGDKRDPGAMISGKPFPQIEAAFMILNGNSQNKTDGNTQKDLAGRVVVKPIGGLSVGGSVYRGSSGNEGKIPQNRWAAEAAYTQGPITTYGEVIVAEDSLSGPAKSQSGAYAGFLYQVNDQWQPGIRYEFAGNHFESNRLIPRHRVTLGVNYSVEKNARIQLNYVYGKFSRKISKTSVNTVYINCQVFF